MSEKYPHGAVKEGYQGSGNMRLVGGARVLACGTGVRDVTTTRQGLSQDSQHVYHGSSL